MKLTLVILCLLGAASANPILHSVAMETTDAASNSTSSMSESTEEINAVDQDSSQENTSEDTTSESTESSSSEQTSEKSQSHSLEERFATGETGMTVDDSQGSNENMRKVGMLVISVTYCRVYCL
ncbi:secretory calcium-binding phosphoprotein 1 [Tachysurus ichikawai]